MNYGGIGAVIGHEMGHGFDDQGRSFDSTGAPRDWWTKTDAAEYQKRAKVLVDQFAEFEPLPGLHVNGEPTLGENIADLTGLVIARQAYLLSLKARRRRHQRDSGRSTVLHGMGAVVEGEATRRVDAPASADQRAFAGDVSREWTDSQYSGVLRSLWGEGGRQVVSPGRQESKDLVRVEGLKA